MTEPDFWRCKMCGCLWRDNHDNTVSLASAKQTSCGGCEHNPTSVACEPLFRALASASASPHPETFGENETKDVLTALYQDGHVDLVLADRVAALMASTNSGESVIAGTDLEGRAGKPPLGAISLSAASEHIDSPESLGLSIDMLDVDRLREWARLLLVHGADISHWGSVPFVASKMQIMATELEKAVRDIGILRGASASPQAKGEPDLDIFVAAIRTLREQCRVNAASEASSHAYRERQHTFMLHLDEALRIVDETTPYQPAASALVARTPGDQP